jgi:hypothetical protein
MNERIKDQLAQVRNGLDRLEAAVEIHPVHPDTVPVLATHLQVLEVFLNNWATGIGMERGRNAVRGLAPPSLSPYQGVIKPN